MLIVRVLDTMSTKDTQTDKIIVNDETAKVAKTLNPNLTDLTALCYLSPIKIERFHSLTQKKKDGSGEYKREAILLSSFRSKKLYNFLLPFFNADPSFEVIDFIARVKSLSEQNIRELEAVKRLDLDKKEVWSWQPSKEHWN